MPQPPRVVPLYNVKPAGSFPVTPIIPPPVKTLDEITSAHENMSVQCLSDLWTNMQSITAGSIGGVPATRQVIAGSGLLGGGDLSADRTFSVDFSKTVATTRQVIAGAGLTGGGPLSADVTLALDATKSVTSFNTRVGAVTLQTADLSNASGVVTTGSYANPAWITSLDAAKLTGSPPPAVIAASQTPWRQNIDGGAFSLMHVGGISYGMPGAGAYPLDYRNLGNASAFHLSLDASDSGGYIGSHIADTLNLSAGIALTATPAWMAKATQGSIIQLTGGNITFITVAGATVGSTSVPLQQCMKIAGATGNVSIGHAGILTQNPQYLLDISGSSVATSQLHVSYDGSDVGGYISADSAGASYFSSGIALIGGAWIAKTGGWSFVATAAGQVVVRLGTGATVGSAIGLPAPMIHATTTGVAINAASPQCSLDVTGTVRSTNYPPVATSGIGVEMFYVPAQSTGKVIAYDRGASVYKALDFEGTPTLINATTQSNIGFGTNNPLYFVDINGHSVATSQLHISYDGSDTGGYFYVGGGGGLTVGAGIAQINSQWIAKASIWTMWQNAPAGFSVWTGAGASVGSLVTLPTQTLYVGGSGTGCVGIATATPGCTLEAFGMIRSSGLGPVPSSGPGVEIYYQTAGDYGFVGAYNRSTSTRKLLYILGSPVTVGVNTADSTGCTLQVTGGISNNNAVVSAPSDIRLKRDIEPYRAGLAEVLRVDPIRFAYNGKHGTTDGARWVSIDAGAHRDIIPDAITKYAGDLDGEQTELYNFSLQPLVMTMVNAIKELSERLERLESRRQ